MYFSKKLYLSLQFYNFYNLFLTFEQFVERMSIYNSSPLSTSLDDKIEFVNKHHIMQVKSHFNTNIYFATELKKILFDIYGNVKPINNFIFCMIKYYCVVYNLINKQAVSSVLENKRKILANSLSESLKILVSKNMHESNVKFKISKQYIVAYFGKAMCNTPMRCKFHAVFDKTTKVFNCEIIESEVLINTDGTFQYNALAHIKNYGIGELSIKFYYVSIK